jgi:protein-disulfide isomerase
MHDIIFENQEHLNEDDLLSYAKIIGLNEQIFIKDFQSKTPLDKINADIKYGEKAGVDSTPTFFINGTLYTGNREDEELFLADIQQMLSYLKQ